MLGFLLGLASGFVVYWVGYYFGYGAGRRAPLPYRWECPVEDCAVTCSSTNMVWVDRFASDHRQREHP